MQSTSDAWVRTSLRSDRPQIRPCKSLSLYPYWKRQTLWVATRLLDRIPVIPPISHTSLLFSFFPLRPSLCDATPPNHVIFALASMPWCPCQYRRSDSVIECGASCLCCFPFFSLASASPTTVLASAPPSRCISSHSLAAFFFPRQQWPPRHVDFDHLASFCPI